jgi:hypothetical protein
VHCHKVQPGLDPIEDGRVRCFYPLGMPGRLAAIERDGHVGALAARQEETAPIP